MKRAIFLNLWRSFRKTMALVAKRRKSGAADISAGTFRPPPPIPAKAANTEIANLRWKSGKRRAQPRRAVSVFCYFYRFTISVLYRAQIS